MYLIVVVAAVLLALVPILAQPLLGLAVDALDEVSAVTYVGALIASTAIISIPVLLLGAVSPWALRLAVKDVDRAGAVAGRLYAISTAGSLTGTLMSALVLIPLLGTRRTFLLFAFLLALVAVAGLQPRRWFAVLPAVLLLALVLPTGGIKDAGDGKRVIHEEETPYQYARVIERDDGTRTLELNEGHAVHSRYRPDTVLTDDVWDGYIALPVASLRRAPREVVILGNAAGTTARAYEEFWPRTWVDGVEIDGALSDIGREYFDMDNPRLRVHDEDARPYLRRTEKRWDAVFMDAYRQPYIPFYLTTKEFYELVGDRLSPRGAFIANVGHPPGEDQLERVVTRTMKAVFPHVRRDPITDTNTLMIASRAPISADALRSDVIPPGLQATADLQAARLEEPLSGGEVYTDDHAPVEWLIDKSFLDYAGEE